MDQLESLHTENQKPTSQSEPLPVLHSRKHEERWQMERQCKFSTRCRVRCATQECGSSNATGNMQLSPGVGSIVSFFLTYRIGSRMRKTARTGRSPSTTWGPRCVSMPPRTATQPNLIRLMFKVAPWTHTYRRHQLSFPHPSTALANLPQRGDSVQKKCAAQDPMQKLFTNSNRIFSHLIFPHYPHLARSRHQLI